MSGNVLATAAHRSLRLLAWQAACVTVLAAVSAIVWGVRAGGSVLAGGGIGLIWTVYMVFALFRHSVNHGARLGMPAILVAWVIKIVLTISLLVLAFRSGAFEPLGLLGGLFGAMVAYCAGLTFGVGQADGVDGK